MPNDKPLPHGPIDIHSHLVPDVDDGCDYLDQTLDCIRQLMERGFIGSICTPHVMPSLFPSNTPANIAAWVAELQPHVDAAGLDYRLWPGGEVRIAPEMITWMAEHGTPTLGDSRYVLFDHWNGDWPDDGDALVTHLLASGYTPILAHPERMPLDDATLGALLDRLTGMGVLLQGNLNSLSGGEGPRAALWARRLLREGRYFLLASDAHRPKALEGRFEGLALAEIEAGPDMFEQLVITNPRKILGIS